MRLTALAMACLLVAVPAIAQDKPTIEKLNDAFIAAFNKGGRRRSATRSRTASSWSTKPTPRPFG
jgi:hypothetical protein